MIGKRQKRGSIALMLLGFILFLIAMSPFYLVFVNAGKVTKAITANPLKPPSDWGQYLINIRSVVNGKLFNYGNAFMASLSITVCSLFVILVFSSSAAWVLVRSGRKWSMWLFLTFVSAMVIPFQVLMLPLLQWLKIVGGVLNITILGTLPGIVFCYLGFGASLSIFIFHGFIKSIPLELEEAARIDGCGRFRTFFGIVLPLLKPTMATVLILNGIWIWNDYLLPLLVLGSSSTLKTLPMAVMSFVGAYVKKWELVLTSTMLAMLPIIVVFLFCQKYIIKGMVDGAIK